MILSTHDSPRESSLVARCQSTNLSACRYFPNNQVIWSVKFLNSISPCIHCFSIHVVVYIVGVRNRLEVFVIEGDALQEIKCIP